MAKSKRNRRSKNKIQGSLQGTLTTADPVLGSEIAVHRSNALAIPRATRLSAELEELIELIARERVRVMLAGRHKLMPPAAYSDNLNA